ncbi:MAG TPA: hypothetical protein VFE47_14145 [Tepidisphaeraceae bacterium]|nr:hypothetical protein [Tepidisphaeraceae bacterium]
MEGEELTPEQKFAAEDAATMVPRALMKGKEPEAIVADLVRLGWSAQAARHQVATAVEDLRRFHESPESRQALVQEARRQLAVGLLIAGLGIALSAISVLGAVSGFLPFYLVTYGLILVGLVIAVRGYGRWRVYRKDSLPFSETEGSDKPD